MITLLRTKKKQNDTQRDEILTIGGELRLYANNNVRKKNKKNDQCLTDRRT